VAATLALLAWVYSHGVYGVAWAVAVGGAVGYLALGGLALYTLVRIDNSPPAVDPAF